MREWNKINKSNRLRVTLPVPKNHFHAGCAVDAVLSQGGSWHKALERPKRQGKHGLRDLSLQIMRAWILWILRDSLQCFQDTQYTGWSVCWETSSSSVAAVLCKGAHQRAVHHGTKGCGDRIFARYWISASDSPDTQEEQGCLRLEGASCFPHPTYFPQPRVECGVCFLICSFHVLVKNYLSKKTVYIMDVWFYVFVSHEHDPRILYSFLLFSHSHMHKMKRTQMLQDWSPFIIQRWFVVTRFLTLRRVLGWHDGLSDASAY